MTYQLELMASRDSKGDLDHVTQLPATSPLPGSPAPFWGVDWLPPPGRRTRHPVLTARSFRGQGEGKIAGDETEDAGDETT